MQQRHSRELVILTGFILSILGLALVTWLANLEVRRVKQTIFAAKRAVEQLNIDAGINYLADEYTDGWGFNKTTVYEFGKNLFSRTKQLEITLDNLSIKVDDRFAQANVDIQIKVVLTSEVYSNLELHDVFGTGKPKNPMMVQLVKSADNQWRIRYLALIDTP
ncbi:MAG: hypothetical protein N3A72_11815 [bacterium]|nr:hypothetical protein [bacterium]